MKKTGKQKKKEKEKTNMHTNKAIKGDATIQHDHWPTRTSNRRSTTEI